MPVTELTKRSRGGNGKSPYGIPYISASRLSMFRRCPMQFYLKYILGMKVPTSLSMFKGKMTHGGIEFFFKNRWLGRCLTDKDISEYTIRTWDKQAKTEGFKFKSNAESKKSLDQVIDGTQVYLDEYRSEIPSAIEAELRGPITGFEWPIDLLGYVDFIRDDGMLIEIKTTGRKPSGSKESMIFAHSIQLAAYDILYKQVEGKPLSGIEVRNIVLKKKPEIVPVKVDKVPRVAHQIFRTTLVDLLEACKNKYFPRNPTGMFCTCNLLSECCKV